MMDASSWGSWKAISGLKCLNLSWLTAYSSPVHSTEIYGQVKWPCCQAITVKWILLHLSVSLILEIWFSLDESQTELRPSFILCDATCQLHSFPWQLLFPWALVRSPAWLWGNVARNEEKSWVYVKKDSSAGREKTLNIWGGF